MAIDSIVRHMFNLFIICFYYHHLLLSTMIVVGVETTSLLFTLDHVRYTLSDQILNIPNLGALRGIHINYEQHYYHRYQLINVDAYLGIQYGLVHQRFEPSKERFNFHSRSNSQVNKQIDFGAVCAQPLSINQHNYSDDYQEKLIKYLHQQDEDQCLYMNIYRPDLKDPQKRLPVLLFVHGDGYDRGTGNAFDGAIFASFTKSIVVTINYRLGPFGFLYVSAENKGNYALQDIYTSLHWLKNYVSYFNGDPDRITMYGTGSGAVLASLVVMMETVNGGTGMKKRRKSLVHRLILNEQTFLSPSMTSTLEEILIDRNDVFSSFVCSTSSCLRNRTLISTTDLLHHFTTEQSPIERWIRPLEDPFPFDQSLLNPLRSKFFQETHRLLPSNLQILLTTSSSKRSWKRIDVSRNNRMEYLIQYAYSKWNSSSSQFEFDSSTFNFHQQIIAPLLEYAKYISRGEKSIHIIERLSTKYQSELPLTMGYVLAPSMSVFNETYLNATDIDRQESLAMMDLFANLIHQGDINMKSPFCQRTRCETMKEKWLPIFPDLNFILLRDGELSQERGRYAQVHYLFNNLLSPVDHQHFQNDLLKTWKTLYHVSSHQNYSRSPKSFQFNWTNFTFIFLLTSTIIVLIIVNLFVCIYLTRRGHGCRKREYNCLTPHQLRLAHPSTIDNHRTLRHCQSPKPMRISSLLPEAVV